MKVAVGSKNPVKVQAAKEAFAKLWPDKVWDVDGIEVSSGVSNQPMSDDESIRGAINRANRALKILKASFGVGLEGGLQKIGKRWFVCGWAVVVGENGEIGVASTVRIETPKKIMRLIRKGKELGLVNDIIFKRNNSKQSEGHFGLMTNGVITRKQGYRDGLIMALTRYLQPKLWE